MNEIFKKNIFGRFTPIQVYLIVGNLLLCFSLIVLSNSGVLPLENAGDFLFFAFLLFFFSLYRPGWAFLLFAGTIVLENVNLAPVGFGIAVRPYQFLGGLAAVSLAVRYLLRRLNFELLKLKWHDISIIILAASGFISAMAASDRTLGLKMSLVVSSFAVLYFLSRIFISSSDDLKKTLPFFLGSGLIVSAYGIWQNVRFAAGMMSYEVMPGRPNATFPEADWYGVFLVLMITAIYGLAYHKSCYSERSASEVEESNQRKSFRSLDKLGMTFFYALMILTYISLILTVSRSAWLGMLAATLVFLFLILTGLKLDPRKWNYKGFFWNFSGIAVAGIISVAVVYFFNLTSFQLLNRAQSTGTGLQKITVACSDESKLPEKVEYSEELIRYGCRHINLEEIKLEQMRGNFIKEIYRKDPNVGIRAEIYAKSWEQIKNNPVLGIGWGSISEILGRDERGAGLNASNSFLEIWLGAGILGLLAFLAVWIWIPVRIITIFRTASEGGEKALPAFVGAAWAGLTVFNAFNSGILLGIFWVFLAVSFTNFGAYENRD